MKVFCFMAPLGTFYPYTTNLREVRETRTFLPKMRGFGARLLGIEYWSLSRLPCLQSWLRTAKSLFAVTKTKDDFMKTTGVIWKGRWSGLKGGLRLSSIYVDEIALVTRGHSGPGEGEASSTKGCGLQSQLSTSAVCNPG